MMKKLFFGLRLDAPWPEEFPPGRLLSEEARHLTLLFLGQQDPLKILSLLKNLPSYPLALGAVGYFDRCMFLPATHPHVAAWHLNLGEEEESLRQWIEKLEQFFQAEGVNLTHAQSWLPHVTLAREPFLPQEWQQHFSSLPFITTSFDLFASSGNLRYETLWQIPLILPFEKLSHTADIAYLVRGTDLRQLYRNALLALAFEYPPILTYTPPSNNIESVEEIIRALNQWVTQADLDSGCPLKAVSYHGHSVNNTPFLEWEMIVDV